MVRSKYRTSACAFVCPLLRAFLIALSVAGGLPALGATPTLRVDGSVAKPATWSATDLDRAFKSQTTVIHYALKGHRHFADAIPLLALVDRSEPSVNPRIKHHALQFVVEVEGADGYTADFSLAELMPEIGDRQVWLAWDEDGKPLASDDAPAQIVSPDDRRPARWVHGIAVITVVDMASGTK